MLEYKYNFRRSGPGSDGSGLVGVDWNEKGGNPNGDGELVMGRDWKKDLGLFFFLKTYVNFFLMSLWRPLPTPGSGFKSLDTPNIKN